MRLFKYESLSRFANPSDVKQRYRVTFEFELGADCLDEQELNDNWTRKGVAQLQDEKAQQIQLTHIPLMGEEHIAVEEFKIEKVGIMRQKAAQSQAAHKRAYQRAILDYLEKFTEREDGRLVQSYVLITKVFEEVYRPLREKVDAERFGEDGGCAYKQQFYWSDFKNVLANLRKKGLIKRDSTLWHQAAMIAMANFRD